jgi:hypothetical protein
MGGNWWNGQVNETECWWNNMLMKWYVDEMEIDEMAKSMKQCVDEIECWWNGMLMK